MGQFLGCQFSASYCNMDNTVIVYNTTIGPQSKIHSGILYIVVVILHNVETIQYSIFSFIYAFMLGFIYFKIICVLSNVMYASQYNYKNYKIYTSQNSYSVYCKV